jgi:hypothetical protein
LHLLSSLLVSSTSGPFPDLQLEVNMEEKEPTAIERVATTETVDTVAESAIGGDYHDLPKGYYRSPKFIGSFIGVILMAQSLYVGYVLPVGSPFHEPATDD